MRRKRRLKVKNLLILIALLIVIIVLFVLLVKTIISLTRNDNENVIDEIVDNEIVETYLEFDLDLYSKAYILVDVDEEKILYGKNIDDRICPASLTKVLTLNTVVNTFSDYSQTSSFTLDDYNELIEDNASLANFEYDHEYTIEELLYGLILPSGADSARALEHYFDKNGLNLVQEMNRTCDRLNLNNSYFTNAIGLDDHNLYTTLSDYSKIVLDTLKNTEGSKILKTITAQLGDEITLTSTLSSLSKRDDSVLVLGGKTGFTSSAGENILVIYEYEEKTYFLVLVGANGNPYNGQYYHIDDVNKIFEFLYN